MSGLVWDELVTIAMYVRPDSASSITRSASCWFTATVTMIVVCEVAELFCENAPVAVAWLLPVGGAGAPTASTFTSFSTSRVWRNVAPLEKVVPAQLHVTLPGGAL